MTSYEMVREFHRVFHSHLDLDINSCSPDIISLRLDLIAEEYKELLSEIFVDQATIDKKKLSKELADMLYVLYGLAATFGLPIDEVFSEVHQSNLSKLDENGQPIFREDGKVMKGPHYKPPQLEFIFK